MLPLYKDTAAEVFAPMDQIYWYPNFFKHFFCYIIYFFYILPWTFFSSSCLFSPLFIIVAFVSFVFPNSFITLIREKTEKNLLPFKTTQRAWIYLSLFLTYDFFSFFPFFFVMSRKGFSLRLDTSRTAFMYSLRKKWNS